MKLLGTDARVLTIILMVLGLEAAVWADGGLLRTRQQAGPFIVSIFTAPELRAGPVDVSVLVQSSGGTVLSDAVVDILLESATSPIERRQARATADAAANKLVKAAVVDLPAAGQWTLSVSVQFNGDAARVTCLLPVAPARSTNEPDLAVAPRAACRHRAVRRAPGADASEVIGACVEIGGRRQPRFTTPHGTVSPGMMEGPRKAGDQPAVLCGATEKRPTNRCRQ